MVVVPTLQGEDLEKMIAQGSKALMKTEIPLAQILREIKTFKEQYQAVKDLRETVQGHTEMLLEHSSIIKQTAERREVRVWVEDLRNDCMEGIRASTLNAH